MREFAASDIRTASAHGVKLAVAREKYTRHAGSNSGHTRSRRPSAGSRPFDCVHSREGSITITSISGDGPSPNTRRHATSIIEMQRKVGSRVAVDDLDIGYATANVAGQSQIARVDRPWINSLVKVHIIRVVAWCWRRERAANRRVSRSNLQRRYNVTERAQELEVPHPVRNTIKCAGWDIHRLQSLREDRRAGVVEGDLCIAIGEGRWQVRRGSVHCEIACLNS